MGLFRKKDKVIDLTERYKKQQARIAEMKKEKNSSPSQTSTPSSTSAFGFFDKTAPNSSSGTQTESSNISEEEKRRRLAKRLVDITDRLEDLSNQIYHLQQRIDLLEKKVGVKSMEGV